MTYDLPDWQNAPSTSTPMSADNLDKYNLAVADLDDRVGDLEAVDIVSSVTAGDDSITLGGTAANPTVAVDQANLTFAESQVTGLVADLDAVDAELATKADDSAVVHLTGAQTVAGVKTFSSAPVVPVGAAAGNPVRRDDSRLTDSRTPTGTAGGALNGSYPNPSLDAVPWAPSTLSFASTINADPTVSNSFDVTATGNITSLGVSTSGATNGQMVVIAVFCSSSHTVTPATGTIGAQTIPAGAVGFFGFRYHSGLNSFVCIAYQASS